MIKTFLRSTALLIGLVLIGCTNQNIQRSRNLANVEKQQKYEVWQLKSIDDGDTLNVVRGQEELKIRFCGIDAPDKKQQFAIQAREHLRALVELSNGELLLVPIEKDGYQRTVAEVYVQDSENTALHLNMQMIRDGYALSYYAHDNCSNQEGFILAEELARREGLGIWNRP